MKTRSRIFLSLLAVALIGTAACNGRKKTEVKIAGKQSNIKKPKVGDVRDEHGCLTSGGYVWSEAKDSCIRLWESGAELVPTNRSELVVFVVESGDKNKAEVIIPDDGTVMLTGSGNGTYNNDSLTLTVTGNNYVLKLNGKAIYQTASLIPAEEAKPVRKKRRRR
jgi:hypothetical protein